MVGTIQEGVGTLTTSHYKEKKKEKKKREKEISNHPSDNLANGHVSFFHRMYQFPIKNEICWHH